MVGWKDAPSIVITAKCWQIRIIQDNGLRGLPSQGQLGLLEPVLLLLLLHTHSSLGRRDALGSVILTLRCHRGS